MANELNARVAELKAKMTTQFKAYKQGEIADFYTADYIAWSKEAEAKAKEARFHSIMAQDKKYASMHLHTDAHAYEIVAEKSDKVMMVRQLVATPTNESMKKMRETFVPGGFFGHTDNSLQEWTFASKEDNPVIAIRKHKDGRWYANGFLFTIESEPREFYDYNF